MSDPPVAAVSVVRRLVAWLIAGELTAFVIPDLRIAHASGLDPVAAGLRTVSNPRHASVLLVIGDLPPGLAEAARIVHAQMARPRMVLGVATDLPGSVLPVDIAAAAGQTGLAEGVRRSRELLARRAWSTATEPVSPLVDQPSRSEESEGHDQMSHGDQHATQGPDEAAGRQEMDRDESDHPGMSHGDQTMDHDDHMMDHGDDGGFMSMIAMTKDLPRSRDGLAMEWVETAFGPLFAGLPAGLALTLTLDGDTVAAATVKQGVTHRGIASSLPCPAAAFPHLLSRLDPLAPASYRVLASRALEAIADPTEFHPMERGWLGAIEWERAVNHLGWLAAFAELLGVAWLANRASELQLSLLRTSDIGAIVRLRPDIDRFLDAVHRTPLLNRRLAGVGEVDWVAAAKASGPVARGSGVVSDARSANPIYAALGFAPVLRTGGDARSRLDVRLAEISQSLALVTGVGSRDMQFPDVPPDVAGAGMAVVETPRGTATVRIEVANGHVQTMRLDTPSERNLLLVPRLAEGAELADALVAIASLDLSPWEVDQ